MNYSIYKYPNNVHATGFTLIELLIAMLVLAVGAMGAAALQIATYKQLQTSHNFSYASILAGEMADRMTANSTVVSAYTNDAPNDTPDPDCSSTACTEAQMAAYDVFNWQARVVPPDEDEELSRAGFLPSGSGEITQSGDAFTITVRWDDDLSGSTGTDCDSTDVDDLNCYKIQMEF